MNHSHQHHRARRARLIAEMRRHSGGGIAAIPTAPQAIRNADTHYPYRPDSYFYYLCGFPEAEAVVVLLAGADEGDSSRSCCAGKESRARDLGRLSLRPRRRARNLRLRRGVFDRRAGDEADRLERRSRRRFYADRWIPCLGRPVITILNEVRNRVRTGVAAPEVVVDVRAALSSDAPDQGRAGARS